MIDKRMNCFGDNILVACEVKRRKTWFSRRKKNTKRIMSQVYRDLRTFYILIAAYAYTVKKIDVISVYDILFS